MTSRERVMLALSFRPPDRAPILFQAWPEFAALWREPADTPVAPLFGSDMLVVAADETAWPTRAGRIAAEASSTTLRTGWGTVERIYQDAAFTELVEPGLRDRIDLDDIRFDDPPLDVRYIDAGTTAARWSGELAVFCKTGGPYQRAATMRGEENFLLDIAEDRDWVRGFVSRVADHIASVGVESIRRFGLRETGIAIYDDVCNNFGPIMGPQSYEDIFLPNLRKMVTRYKDAGAAKVIHHCDGDVRPLLEMWVDAGIDAVNPLEPRACGDALRIREKFGRRLAIIGGLDNSVTLPRGNRGEILAHLRRLIDAARDGGLIIAPHSIGTDVTVETVDFMLEVLERYGRYRSPTAANEVAELAQVGR